MLASTSYQMFSPTHIRMFLLSVTVKQPLRRLIKSWYRVMGNWFRTFSTETINMTLKI